MSALLRLRDYQTEAIKELHSRWDAGDTRVPMVLATGLGKTVIFAHLIAEWIRSNVTKRALVLVHTDELVRQAVQKIRDSAPHLHVGIVKAEQNDVTARVIVASVQSLRSPKRRAMIRNVGLIIVDECHHATAKTYRDILEHFGAFAEISECQECAQDTSARHYPRHSSTAVKVAGFTATLARGDKAKLSDVWQACTFKRGIAFGIRRGYLLDVRGKRIVVPDFNLSTVKKSGGDYQDGSLAEELDRSFAPSIVADAYVEHAQNRKGLGFAPTVESAHHFAQAFETAGIPSAVVSGETPKEERRLILKRLHAGDVQVVWNCAVLTEGFDEPTVSCIVNARPTKSAPLYQQMIGRGLRPDLELAPDERGDCLVLDVTPFGSSSHDLRTLVDLSERAPEGAVLEDGDSLLDFEDELEELERQEAETPETAEELYFGETIAVDFDPLARTGIGAWLCTDGGTYFLPVGKEAYVLLVSASEPAKWDVAWLTQSPNGFLHTHCPGRTAYVTAYRMCSCGANHQGGQGDLTEHRNLSLDMATSWAEEVLETLGGADALHEAGVGERWRKAPISFQWKKLCAKYGIEITKGMHRGDVHDLVSTAIGSRRIDPVVTFMQSMQS